MGAAFSGFAMALGLLYHFEEVARLDMDVEQSYKDYLASLRAIRVEEEREERGRDRKL